MTKYYTVKRGDMWLSGFQDNGIKDDLGIKHYTCLWSNNRRDAAYTSTKEIMDDLARLNDGRIINIEVSDGG